MEMNGSLLVLLVLNLGLVSETCYFSIPVPLLEWEGLLWSNLFPIYSGSQLRNYLESQRNLRMKIWTTFDLLRPLRWTEFILSQDEQELLSSIGEWYDLCVLSVKLTRSEITVVSLDHPWIEYI